MRAIEAEACVDVNQVRPEAGGEGPLHLQNVRSPNRRRRDLPIRGGVDAGSIDNLACEKMDVS